MTNEKIDCAIERAIQSGYVRRQDGLTLESTIEFLCDEVDRYRAKINTLEKTIEQSKSYTVNEKRISENLPPIEEDKTAVLLIKKEKQAFEFAKIKMLTIYETLSPEEQRAWDMGEVYEEIIRGLE